MLFSSRDQGPLVGAATDNVVPLIIDPSHAQSGVRSARLARRAPVSQFPVATGESNDQVIVHVVGARPNFVKMAPVIEALGQRGAFAPGDRPHRASTTTRGCPTTFSQTSTFPTPDHFLGVGSGSHGEQTAKVLAAFETSCSRSGPAAVVVAGDVNSTLACALAAAKLGMPVAHLEAGLRSGDWTHARGGQPGRSPTGSPTCCFTHSPEADDEPRAPRASAASAIHYVGNTMIDSLRRCERRARGARASRDHGLARRRATCW